MGEISNPDFDDIQYFGDVGVFRWDSSGRSRTLPAWTNSPFLQGISGNGSTATGIINRMPVIWNETSGAVQLSNLPDPFFSAHITEISSDGNAVIGGYFPMQWGNRYAFRWSHDQGFQPLTDMTEAYSDAWAVSADGQIILGQYKQEPGDLAFDFVWRTEHGIQRLVDYFVAHGVTLPFEGIHRRLPNVTRRKGLPRQQHAADYRPRWVFDVQHDFLVGRFDRPGPRTHDARMCSDRNSLRGKLQARDARPPDDASMLS